MKHFVTALWFLLLAFSSHRELCAQEPFYKGKMFKIVVGSPPGGFYDAWARLLSRHMPKYIPGNPDSMVQNMPGAGSLVATNYVYNIAKPDGLTVVMPNGKIYMDQLAGRQEIKFDVRKFSWVGTQEKTHMMLYMRSDTPYTTLADIRRAKEPPKCGSSGTNDAGFLLPKVLEETIGIKFHVVSGYTGGNQIDLAVERNEIVCRGMAITTHSGREPFETWHKKDFDRHLVQTARKRDSRMADAPTFYELMDQEKVSEVSRRVAHVILMGGEFGRPMLATPGVPAERVNALRQAYVQALKDPELLAEALRGKMDIDPVTGEELQTLAQEMVNQPPEVIDRVKRFLAN
ncbi:MAG: tripartite tricarboxylate transporter substrate-binding protein [Candidatus Binatia bacterium]